MSQAQQLYDECDAVRRCHEDDETARAHRVQCRVFFLWLGLCHDAEAMEGTSVFVSS